MLSRQCVSASECFSLVELLRMRALQEPDKLAYTFLVDGNNREIELTYAELDRRARAIATRLRELGGLGDRVMLLYPAGLEFIAGFFGCLYAGMVAVPAYPPRPNRSLSYLLANLRDAQATVALTTAAVLTGIERRFVQAPDLRGLRWLLTEAIDLDAAEDWSDPGAYSDTLAFLQYTSGSTASPKGVRVSHGNVLHNERLIKHAAGLSETSIAVGWLPLFHDMGLIGNMIGPVYVGVPQILLSPLTFLQRPVSWLQTITRYKATSSGGPNFGYDLCVRKITPEQRVSLDLSSWTTAFNGSEPIRRETLDGFVAAFEACGFRREAFYPCYGLAEATLFVSGGERGAAPNIYSTEDAGNVQSRPATRSLASRRARALVGCGRAWLDQKIIIVDPDSLLACAEGQVGEIWVSSQSVAQGYWNRPEQTEQTFRAHLAVTGEGPFLRTGDLGFVRDGELFVSGRIKDLIIICGRNLYPDEIEQTAQACHPALRRGGGTAFSIDVTGEEQLVIVQEIEARETPDIDELVGSIRQAIAEEYEVQLHGVVLIKPGTLPKTTSGKIQRRACRDSLLAGSLQGVVAWRGEPLTATMTAVASAGRGAGINARA